MSHFHREIWLEEILLSDIDNPMLLKSINQYEKKIQAEEEESPRLFQ